MRVSIVVTNHDYGRFLPACIDSALGQTYPATQVVVVDDGSTDGSADIVRAYGERVDAVHKPNGGQASAFNAGFARADGDVVLFLDADDVLEPNAAEIAVRLLRDGRATTAHWPLRVIDAHGSPTGALKPGPASSLPAGDRRAEVAVRGPTTMLFPPTSGHAWTRTFLERVLPMDEHVFRLGADTYLFELAPFAGVLRRWDQPLSRYRAHGGNGWRRLGFDEILRRELAFYDACVPVACRLAREEGWEPEPDRWRAHSWWHRLSDAVARIDAAVPAGRPYLLADDGAWGLDATGGRHPRPFPGRDGVPWGSPIDDAHAVAELERERRAGAVALVLGWPCFWWLDHYVGFARHLTDRYRSVVADDTVRIVDLTRAH